MMCEAYEQRIAVQRGENLEAWRRARLIAYTNCSFKDPVPSIWDFMPLEGDPTPDELSAMKDAEAKRNETQWNSVLDQYKQLGILTENVIAVA